MIAHNMVAWFSHRITVGESNWADQFERKKIDGKWAYRPKSPGADETLGMANMVHWDTECSLDTPIEIEYVDHFDARGMRRVYGRGDHFGRKAAFNMDIWRDRNSDLLARFWSRNSEVDNLSLAIHGIPADSISERKPDAAFSDEWIPQALRQEYEQWILGEW